jgi:hypothetical protein
MLRRISATRTLTHTRQVPEDVQFENGLWLYGETAPNIHMGVFLSSFFQQQSFYPFLFSQKVCRPRISG